MFSIGRMCSLHPYSTGLNCAGWALRQVHAPLIDSGLHAHTEIFHGRMNALRSLEVLVPHRLGRVYHEMEGEYQMCRALFDHWDGDGTGEEDEEEEKIIASSLRTQHFKE